MNDHANRGRGDFSQRMNQVRREAEQLLRQAREIKEQMGGLWGPSGRPAGAAPGSSDRPGERGEGLYRPAGFPYQFETLGRSFAELEACTQKIAGRDEELKKSLRDLEVRSEEIAGVAASLGETLGVKTASLARLGVWVREISAGRRILKRDQEELSGAVNETIGLLEQRELGRRLLFDLAQTTLIQGEKKRDHLEEILTNQKALAEHLENCGKWLERTLALYEGGQAGFNHISGYHFGFPDSGDEYIGCFTNILKVLCPGMTDGNGGMFCQQKNGDRFSDDITPTHDNRLFSFDFDAGGFNEMENTQWCTSNERRCTQ